MGGIFKKPKKKKAKTPIDKDAIAEALRRQNLTERHRRGAGGNILTGPSGLLGAPGGGGSPTLLGGL